MKIKQYMAALVISAAPILVYAAPVNATSEAINTENTHALQDALKQLVQEANISPEKKKQLNSQVNTTLENPSPNLQSAFSELIKQSNEGDPSNTIPAALLGALASDPELENKLRQAAATFLDVSGNNAQAPLKGHNTQSQEQLRATIKDVIQRCTVTGSSISC